MSAAGISKAAEANRSDGAAAAPPALPRSRTQLVAASVLFFVWLLFLTWMALDP